MLAFSGLMFLVLVRLGLDPYAACPAKYGDGSSFRPGDIVALNVIASTYRPLAVAGRAPTTASITALPFFSTAFFLKQHFPTRTAHLPFLSDFNSHPPPFPSPTSFAPSSSAVP